MIPNYNGEAVIGNCLQSVLLDTANTECEIIIIDNGSTDKSLEIIKSVCINNPKMRLITLPRNLGYSGACHFGYKVSKGDYIVLLSNDVIVDTGWLNGLLDKLKNSEGTVGAVQSKLRLMDYPTKIDSAGHMIDRLLFLRPTGYLEEDHGQYDSANDVCVLQVVSCILKREVIERVGGLFDPIYFTIHEDTDLSIRLLLGGYTFASASDSIVYHKRSWTISRFPPELLVYLTRRNATMTIIKNYQTRNVMLYGCLGIVFNFLMMVWYIMCGQGRSALAIIKAYLWNIRHLKKILMDRTFVQQKVRRISDKDAFKSFDSVSLLRLIKFRKYGNLLTVHLKPENVNSISEQA